MDTQSDRSSECQGPANEIGNYELRAETSRNKETDNETHNKVNYGNNSTDNVTHPDSGYRMPHHFDNAIVECKTSSEKPSLEDSTEKHHNNVHCDESPSKKLKTDTDENSLTLSGTSQSTKCRSRSPVSNQSQGQISDIHVKGNTSDEPKSENLSSKTDINSSKGSSSSSRFQFLPRSVSKGQGQENSSEQISVRHVSNISSNNQVSKDPTQKCDSQNLNSDGTTRIHSEVQHSDKNDSAEKMDVSKNDSSSSSSSSESENEATHPYIQKSYDANVVLPEDIIKTWRTSNRIKEGEIVEIESQSDSPYIYEPTCFAKAVSDFYSLDNKNYLRGCKWSPDGKCLLTNSNDNRLRVFNTPEIQDNDQEEMRSFLKVKEADTVYDFCWYNKMSYDDPDTCSFLTTCKDGPIHMWDMNTGSLKCTYRPYNHLDEITTAHSLAFSLDGRKLYTGYNRMIRVFDVDRPGRDCIQRATFSKHQGQPGIISCIAASPQGSGIYAAGSYARAIALYHEPDGSMLCMFQGQQGGVTHLGFSPDGTKLYSGGRKDPEILCWDLRKPGQILFVALRLCETNQRLYFDQDSSGRHLFSGCHDGTVCVWDTCQSPVKVLPESDPLLKPVMKFKAHGDCVNGISMNHTNDMIATCSGQRHYPDIGDSDSDSDSTDTQCIENTVKLWKFDKR